MITNSQNILKKNTLNGDILLIGVEEYNIDQDFKLILDKFFPNRDEDYNFHKVDATEQSLSSVIDLANSFPMLGDNTTIVCKNFHVYFEGRIKKSDKNPALIENYLKNPNPSTRLILCASQDKFSKIKDDKFPKPWDILAKNCETVFYRKVWPDKYPNWIQNKFSENSINTSQEVIRVILSQTPENLRDIGNQIEKIITFLSSKKELDVDIIYKIIGNSRTYNVFELQKQVIRRNLESSLDILKNIYTNSKADIISITSIFSNFFKNVLKFYELKEFQNDKFTLARKIGISPFFINDIKLAASSYNPKEIEKIFILLSETDLKLKSTSESQLNLITKLLINIISK